MISNSNKGFTLVEILVVMVLLAILGSLVFINTGKSIVGNQNETFVREMLSLCRKARRIAIESSVPIAFFISSNERRCWIKNSNRSLEIPEQMLIEGQGIHQLNKDIHTIRFYPDGSSDGGELTLSISGEVIYSFRVDILTGMVTPIEEDV